MVETKTKNQGLQAIDQSPSKVLVLSLVDIIEFRDPRAADIIKENPVAVQIAQAFAYEHPDLIELDRRPILKSDLKDIRENYPTVTQHFLNNILSEVLHKNPMMGWRLEMGKRALGALPEEVQEKVADIEFILKLLIEDGRNRNLSLDDYGNIKNSHEFFGSLVEHFEDSGETFYQVEEKDNFIQIGQRLLITRSLFEVRTEELDLEYSKKNQKTGEQDFNGLKAQMAFISRIAGACKDSKDPVLVAGARVLKTDAQSVFDDIYRRHPGRLPEIHRKYPDLVGISDFPWAEHPGGPDLSKAEQRDTTNGGNNYH